MPKVRPYCLLCVDTFRLLRKQGDEINVEVNVHCPAKAAIA